MRAEEEAVCDAGANAAAHMMDARMVMNLNIVERSTAKLGVKCGRD